LRRSAQQSVPHGAQHALQLVRHGAQHSLQSERHGEKFLEEYHLSLPHPGHADHLGTQAANHLVAGSCNNECTPLWKVPFSFIATTNSARYTEAQLI
jgi:hypothetical protein